MLHLGDARQYFNSPKVYAPIGTNNTRSRRSLILHPPRHGTFRSVPRLQYIFPSGPAPPTFRTFDVFDDPHRLRRKRCPLTRPAVLPRHHPQRPFLRHQAITNVFPTAIMLLRRVHDPPLPVLVKVVLPPSFLLILQHRFLNCEPVSSEIRCRACSGTMSISRIEFRLPSDRLEQRINADDVAR